MDFDWFVAANVDVALFLHRSRPDVFVMGKVKTEVGLCLRGSTLLARK